MRIGVYGGSFNPPHVGHALVAAWLGWTARVDAVWLVPAYQHAFDKPLAPFDVRLAACRALAATVGPWVAVSDVEARLPAPSYTVQTLRHLAAAHPEHRFRLVIGADVLPQTALWREWAAIERDYAPIVVGRTGYPPVDGAPCFPDVSSTEVRRRLAAGEAVDHLVPASVLAAWRSPSGIGAAPAPRAGA